MSSEGFELEPLEVLQLIDKELHITACTDSDGATFSTCTACWTHALKKMSATTWADWYKTGNSYWQSDEAPATVDGALGGFAHISPSDIAESRSFWARVAASLGSKSKKAVDCGAGVGRVTTEFLCQTFDQVDLVEQNRKHLTEAARLLEPTHNGRMIEAGMQWCVGYLTDFDMIAFLQRCANSLAPEGCIIIKDNVSRKGKACWMDLDDASVTRSDEYLRWIFERAGLEIVCDGYQQAWPAELFPVWMVALRPKANTAAVKSDAS